MTDSRSRDRGAVLIISIGILSVLLLIAISFARLMVVERDVSKNHREQVQARMAAESGIEHVVAWFRNNGNFQPTDGLADPVSRTWIFKNDLTSDVGAGQVDLATAQAPSFQYPHVVPCSGVVDDARYGYDRNFYKLKVLDTHSQINLNNPERVLRKLLENLGQSIQALGAAGEQPNWWRPTYGAVPNPFTAAVIDAIIAKRQTVPNGFFTAKEEIRVDVAGTEVLNDVEYRLVEDYLAVRGWQNDRAVHQAGGPNAQISNPGVAYDNWYRAASGWVQKTDPVNTLVPELESRYPININTAPKAVLIANLTNFSSYRRVLAAGAVASIASGGLAGNYPALRTLHQTAFGDQVGPLTFNQAKQLAEAIIAYRGSGVDGPFRNWQQFFLFVRRQSYLSRDEQHLIIANCFPGLMSNQFLGERQRHYAVSKSLIFGPTTEFCFNSMGHFEVTSLGWVQNDLGQILAEVEIYAEFRVWDIMYRGSQRDWLSSMSQSQNAVTGPESIHNTIASSMSNPTDAGLNDVYGNDLIARSGSPYEGYIQALTENFRMTGGGYLGVPGFQFNGSPNAGQTFHAGYLYNASGLPYDAMQAAGSKTAGGETGPGLSKKAGETVFRGESLTPDGVLFRNYNDEELNYDIAGNFNGQTGTIEMWIKLAAGVDGARGGSGWGSHEPIFYMNQYITPAGQTPRLGVTWKLERYGYSIRSTRFFWMTPVPQTVQPLNVTGLTYLWTEKSVRIDSPSNTWNDGEWHHLVHSWDNFTDQAFFVDGKEAGPGVTQFPLTPLPGTTTRLELVSIDPAEKIFPGGFIFQKSSPTAVFNGFTNTGYRGTVVRVGNCKLDEIRGYGFAVAPNNGALLGAGLWPRSRYEFRGAQVFFEGEFDIPTSGTVAHVAFTTLYPESYGKQSFVVGNDRVQKKVTVDYRVTVNGNPVGANDEGTQTLDRAQAAANDKLNYRIDFRTGAQDYNHTPTVEDMMVYIVVPPTFFSYRQLFER